MKPEGLSVQSLRVSVASSGVTIVDGLDLHVAPGEILGLVGESGSGKTTAGLAMLGHSRRGTRITGGSVHVAGTDVLSSNARQRTRIRGRLISYVPQDPSSALNPSLRIGTQLREVLDVHDFGTSADDREERLIDVLREVGLPSTETYLRRYPHQLSGGQQQRIGIAMAFACRPKVIVLDEPTTGLDVTTQTHVLSTVRKLCSEHGVAAVYITHDLAVVAEIATRVAVLYAGNLVEIGPAEQVLTRPAHPYTDRLIRAAPDLDGKRRLTGLPGHAPGPGRRPDGCHFAPRCPYVQDLCTTRLPELLPVATDHNARCVRVSELQLGVQGEQRVAPQPTRVTPAPLLTVDAVSAAYGEQVVLDKVSLDIGSGQCVILLGESGSGKTTLARCIAGLHDNYTGTVSLSGEPVPPGAARRTRQQRRAVQYVFQSPYGSLNPRKTIGDSIAEPLRALTDVSAKEHRFAVAEMTGLVALRPELIDRYPDQLSGGERQRAAIARSLISNPALLVCDEVTSSLDVSVQASIIELLQRLQAEMDLTLLFVTHNIALVRHVAQQVAVLRGGRIVEFGGADDVLANPQDSYTQQLLLNTPRF